MDFLNYVAETSKAWDEPNPKEVERVRPTTNQRGGMYSLPEDMKMKETLSTLARRLEELEMRNQHEVRTIAEAPIQIHLASFASPLITKESIAQLILQ